jgi:drug/metabolite transporter (DMT)-like permease
MSWPAVLGLTLVLLGIFGIASTGPARWGERQTLAKRMMSPGVRYALLTGLAISGYSILDKQGVKHVSPLLYVTLLTAGGGLGMLGVISRRYSRTEFRAEIAANWRAIVVGGVLQTAAYGLVLFALRVSPVSYVAPFREVGIIFGVVLGAIVLKERVTRRRLAAGMLIAAGALAIALAP